MPFFYLFSSFGGGGIPAKYHLFPKEFVIGYPYLGVKWYMQELHESIVVVGFLVTQGCSEIVGSGLQLYTQEFYENVVLPALKPGGIFVTQAGPAGVLACTDVFTVIHNTLKGVFPKVVPYTAAVPSYADAWVRPPPPTPPRYLRPPVQLCPPSSKPIFNSHIRSSTPSPPSVPSPCRLNLCPWCKHTSPTRHTAHWYRCIFPPLHCLQCCGLVPFTLVTWNLVPLHLVALSVDRAGDGDLL